MSQKARTKLLFAAYCAVMLWLLFFQRRPYAGPLNYQEYLREFLNPTPFDTIQRWMRVFRGGFSPNMVRFALKNLLGNVALFVPLGLFLPALWKWQKRIWVFFPTVVLTILLVETTQLLTTLGSFDIDDLILNAAGALMGFLLWKLTHRALSRGGE